MPSTTSDPDADSTAQSDEREDVCDASDTPGDDADLQAVIDHYERLLAAREREADDDDAAPDPTRPRRPGAIARLVRCLRGP